MWFFSSSRCPNEPLSQSTLAAKVVPLGVIKPSRPDNSAGRFSTKCRGKKGSCARSGHLIWFFSNSRCSFESLSQSTLAATLVPLGVIKPSRPNNSAGRFSTKSRGQRGRLGRVAEWPYCGCTQWYSVFHVFLMPSLIILPCGSSIKVHRAKNED